MSKIRVSVVAVAISMCSFCAADSPKSDAKKDAAAPEVVKPADAGAAIQKYDMKGKILAVDKSAKQLTVDHEAIPNFMGAMAMPYTVKDDHALETVSVGDQITAKVVSTASGYWLEDVVVTGKAKP
jgi:Cu/Ag efflux protein CusF